LEDDLVGSLDGGVESPLRLEGGVRLRGSEGGEEGLYGEMAGDLSGGGSAHAVADDESTGRGICGTGVLIALADEAGVSEHGVDEMAGLQGLFRYGSKRKIHGLSPETKATLV
jgi:hypothetical protein